MPMAPVGHRVETVEHCSDGLKPRTDYTATCMDCRWMGLSRDNHWQADRDVESHIEALRLRRR